jgi:hypothetical protein
LNQDCTAIIGWYDLIHIDDERRFWAGDVPPEIMIAINDRVRADIARRVGREVQTVSEIVPLLFED